MTNGRRKKELLAALAGVALAALVVGACSRSQRKGAITIINTAEPRLVKVEGWRVVKVKGWRGNREVFRRISGKPKLGESGTIHLSPGVYRLRVVDEEYVGWNVRNDVFIEPGGTYTWYVPSPPPGKASTLLYYHPDVPWPDGAVAKEVAQRYLVENEPAGRRIAGRLENRLENLGLTATVETHTMTKGALVHVGYSWSGSDDPPGPLVWPEDGEKIICIVSRRYSGSDAVDVAAFRREMLEAGWTYSGQGRFQAGRATAWVDEGEITATYEFRRE